MKKLFGKLRRTISAALIYVFMFNVMTYGADASTVSELTALLMTDTDIRLTADLNEANLSFMVARPSETITLDLNGHTISSNADGTGITRNNLITLTGGNLIIKNGTINAERDDCIFMILSDLTLENVTINSPLTNFAINSLMGNVTLEADVTARTILNMANPTSVVTVRDGTYIGADIDTLESNITSGYEKDAANSTAGSVLKVIKTPPPSTPITPPVATPSTPVVPPAATPSVPVTPPGSTPPTTPPESTPESGTPGTTPPSSGTPGTTPPSSSKPGPEAPPSGTPGTTPPETPPEGSVPPPATPPTSSDPPTTTPPSSGFTGTPGTGGSTATSTITGTTSNGPSGITYSFGYGEMSNKEGWILRDDGWHYELDFGKTKAANGWYYLKWQNEYDWYHFDVNGIMQTGFFTDIDGHTYILNDVSDGWLGAMIDEPVDINGVHYEFNMVHDGTYGSVLTA